MYFVPAKEYRKGTEIKSEQETASLTIRDVSRMEGFVWWLI